MVSVRIILSLLLLLSSTVISAQTLSVNRFALDEKDKTAQDDATMRFDQNGEICALIKVITKEKGFDYDVGALGVTEVEEHDGEIWLFVPFGIKTLSLHHQEFGSCEYHIPVQVESGNTYVMNISTNGSTKEITVQEITISCSPTSADLTIDGEPVVLTEGSTTLTLELGVHSYTVEKGSYITHSGTFELKENAPSKLNVTLTRASMDSEAQSMEYWQQQQPVEYSIPGTKVRFTMIPVKPTTFTQGATMEQVNPWDDEMPSHSTTLDGFFIGQTEVTQELWEAVMGTNPSRFHGTELPVEQVSWNDCQVFINRLSAIMGQKFRMPTEAEWELAARGGTEDFSIQYSGSNVASDVAWFVKNSSRSTHTTATKKANKLGVYDMSGNVAEWCQDWYKEYHAAGEYNPKGPAAGTHHVCRGGSWLDREWNCRTSYRNLNTPETSSSCIGLRLAM